MRVKKGGGRRQGALGEFFFLIKNCAQFSYDITWGLYCTASNRVPGLYLFLEVKSGDSILPCRGEWA